VILRGGVRDEDFTVGIDDFTQNPAYGSAPIESCRSVPQRDPWRRRRLRDENEANANRSIESA